MILKCQKLLISILLIGFTSAVDAEELTIAYGLENYNFQQLFDEFSAQTNIKLSVKNFSNNDLKSALIQSANMSQLPDIVIVPSDFIGLTELGFSTIPDTWLSQSLSADALKSAMVADDYKGIPIIYGNHLLLYYNKSIINKPASNWNELISQKTRLPLDTQLIGWNYYEMYWFVPFLGTFGEFPYIDNKVNLQTSGMAEALAWYRELAEKNVVDKNCDYDCSSSAFLSGKLAYTINGSWAFNQYSDELKENLGIALLPQYRGNDMKPYFSSHVIAFPNNGIELGFEKAEKLKQFAEYFQNAQTQMAIWQQLRSLPTNAAIINQLVADAGPNLKVLFEQLKASEPMPNDRNMAIIWEAMLKGVNRYLADIFDNHKAAEYMQYITEKSMNNEKQK